MNVYWEKTGHLGIEENLIQERFTEKLVKNSDHKTFQKFIRASLNLRPCQKETLLQD